MPNIVKEEKQKGLSIPSSRGTKSRFCTTTFIFHAW